MKAERRDKKARKGTGQAKSGADPRIGAPSLAVPGRIWALALGFATIFFVFWAYGPALHSPFVFDDTAQIYALPSASAPLRNWIGPVRPMLNFTYWLNTQISLLEPYSFHVVNVLIHFITAELIFLIVRRLLDPGRQHRDLLAGFASLLFLLHPAQTEAVAYIAGRSESLSAMFSAAAFAVFLYRPKPQWPWFSDIAVLALFGCAVFSKEQAIALPALLLLYDLWWNPGRGVATVKSHWRIYAPIAALGLAAVFVFRKLILGIGTGTVYSGATAGFAIKGLPWYRYLFTEFRAVFEYVRLFVFPVGLDLDWDFPISKTILDHGAIVGLIALLTLAALAWRFRDRFPLAGFGFFTFLLLLAPTSSILPIKDPVAERRLYLPMLGLLLIVIDLASCWKVERKVLAGVAGAIVLLAAVVTHARAEVWSSPVSLWEDTVGKSPKNARDHQQLAAAYYDQGRFDRAVAEYQRSAELETPEYSMLLNWALAYDGLNQPDQALAKLREAAALDPTAHVYSQIGMVYGKRGQMIEAMEALDQAEKRDPNFAMTYYYKGVVDLRLNKLRDAEAHFSKALALDPTLQAARDGLAQTRQKMQIRY